MLISTKNIKWFLLLLISLASPGFPEVVHRALPQSTIQTQNPILRNPAANDTASFNNLLSDARKYALADKPLEALNCYQKILNLPSLTETQKRIALFGLGKMQMWLEKYNLANHTYQTLLNMQLDEEDYQIALQGKIQTLNYLDNPKQSIQLIPQHIHITNPGLVVAIAQAYLWAEKPNQAQAFLNQYKSILDEIPKNSLLKKQLNSLLTSIKTYNKPIAVKKTKNQIADEATVQKVNLIILAAKNAEAANHFELAQRYYLQAYFFAGDDINLQKEILFNLGLLQLNFGYYRYAMTNYQFLLTMPLNKIEYEVALNGYVRSVSAYDKSQQAYNAIPANFNYTMPTMLVGAAQAALWVRILTKSITDSDQIDHSMKE